MQVDPMTPKLTAPGTKRLTLKCDEPLSNFAFKFNSRCYTQDPTVATVYQDATVAHARYILRDIAGNPGVLTSGLQVRLYISLNGNEWSQACTTPSATSGAGNCATTTPEGFFSTAAAQTVTMFVEVGTREVNLARLEMRSKSYLTRF